MSKERGFMVKDIVETRRKQMEKEEAILYRLEHLEKLSIKLTDINAPKGITLTHQRISGRESIDIGWDKEDAAMLGRVVKYMLREVEDEMERLESELV